MVSLGDQYVRKARVYPGLLTTAPLATLVAFTAEAPPFAAVASGVGFVGVFYLIAELTRSMGKKYEARAVAQWGGFPTTRALRHASDGPKALRDRRRQQIETLLGTPLPTARQERAEPQSADAEYLLGVKAVIAKARRDGWYRPLLESENTSYGFRRNMRALRPLAFIILAVGSAAAVGLGFTTASWLAAAFVWGISFIAGLLWAFKVNDAWVEEQALVFSNELFSTLQTMSAPAGSENSRQNG